MNANLNIVVKRVIIAQFVLFIIPIPFLRPAFNELVIKYYLAWLGLVVLTNITLIVKLLLARYEHYVWRALLLFAIPIVLGIFGFFLIIISSGITC